MIETVIRDFVDAGLTVPVEMEFPADPPTRFVVLKRTGEGRKGFVEDTLLIANSYAESALEAAKLNHEVKKVLDELDTLDEISSVQLSTDYPAFDTGNKKYRYQAVYEINHY